MTIPASAIVSVNPGVVSSGGSALALNGVILTGNTRLPIGSVRPFSSPDDVASYFGAMSLEAALAANYFLGFNNSTIKPGSLLFAQYPQEDVAAWVRGQSVAALSLAALKAITGSLLMTIDGEDYSAASIDLSSATSFSAAAVLLTAALDLPAGAAVNYDYIAQAFVITSGTTGDTSTISTVTGDAAAALGFGFCTLSQGANAATPAEA
ncbi:MAG: DUF3383 domain-containing protein, partial [Betaproteobacteria bacterium]|nr:DUF3383 domain-containing protein [Betaproteobacteria bacterium]